MPEAERLTELIGDIYDAALDRVLWPTVLGKTAGFVGGWAGALFWKDALSKTGGAYYDDGRIEPRYRQSYFDEYIKLDPTTTAFFLAEVGEPVGTADLIPYDEFLGTCFYKEWVRPQGLVDAVNSILDKSSTSMAALGIFRHESQGLTDDPARQRMRLIVPHVRRAVTIGRVIDLKSAETNIEVHVAHTLGLAIPDAILKRADRVIK
jgi:hypothetical protein